MNSIKIPPIRIAAEYRPAETVSPIKPKATDTQVDGNHYKNLAIQPAVYIHANKLPFIEGCVIKYITRYKSKNGLKDLQKARHFIDMLIELEYGEQ